MPNHRLWVGASAFLTLCTCAADPLELVAPLTKKTLRFDDPSDPTLVSIADGKLRGAVVGETVEFLGIPYAKPPVGDLRWALPQPPEPWTGVREATEYSKRCAQLPGQDTQTARSEDEDCLYLNVWKPKQVSEPLPVMVWLHGGSNRVGSTSDPVPYIGGRFYSGQKLAEKGVLVVTLNYRLGVFGFFSHPALETANQGLYDQAQALRWVQDNIAQLGGDPERVTLFGESAGAGDTCYHIASPVSRDLFQRAISQSGSCTNKQPTRADVEPDRVAFASTLGCQGDNALECLRGKSVAELLDVQPSATFPSGAVVVDGDFLPDQPRTLFDRGEVANVPYILGTNTDEGTLFLPDNPPSTPAEYASYIRKAMAPIADLLLAHYPLSRFADSPNPARAALARITTDQFVCVANDTAQRAAAAKLPVWMYNFDIPVTVGTDLGATHGAEITFVFDTAPTEDVQRTAAIALVQNAWTTFAKTGNPASEDLDWPRFSKAEDIRINIGLTGPTLIDNYHKPDCNFWLPLIASEL